VIIFVQGLQLGFNDVRVQSLCRQVLDSEAQIAEKLAENRQLRQQIEEYHSQLVPVVHYTYVYYTISTQKKWCKILFHMSLGSQISLITGFQ